VTFADTCERLSRIKLTQRVMLQYGLQRVILHKSDSFVLNVEPAIEDTCSYIHSRGFVYQDAWMAEWLELIRTSNSDIDNPYNKQVSAGGKFWYLRVGAPVIPIIILVSDMPDFPLFSSKQPTPAAGGRRN